MALSHTGLPSSRRMIGCLTFEWICSALDDRSTPCSVLVKNLKKEPWKVGKFCNDKGNCLLSGAPVKYCLSERVEPHCKLHFEPNIAIVVTVLNFCKSKSRPVSRYSRYSTELP
jgi:hypothetical protein